MDPPKAMDVSIIVPTYREAGNLRTLVEGVFAALASTPWNAEMIVVDDDSRDGSEELIAELAGDYPVRILVRTNELDTAHECDYEGYSKHDALNARWLEKLARGSKWVRLGLIQAVMRSPFHIRPIVGVRRARNAKGLSLFARALLARYRVLGGEQNAADARSLLDWLTDNTSTGFPWPCWGYPYPWQDVGFFAPRHLPNRVVTSFVVEALLDGYETIGEARYLEAAEGAPGRSRILGESGAIG